MQRDQAKRIRREQVRSNAYRCVGAAARNRQKKLRPSSPLRPVVTRRVREGNAGGDEKFKDSDCNIIAPRQIVAQRRCSSI